MRVALVLIDSLPNRLVGPETTPHLWELAMDGGWNPFGGQAVMSTATYPNMATFATGRPPASHGILVNRVMHDGEFVPAARVGPAGDTIFRAATRAGLTSAAVVGDHHLIGVMGASDADRHWPPDGRRADVALDEFRYATDAAVLDAVDEVDLVDADLAVVHFNEPDTACHLHGPHAPETAERVAATDAALGAFLERLRPRWDDTVVIVVSDHGQEAVTEHGIDLGADLEQRGLPGIVETEGTAALVVDGPPFERLMESAPITGAIRIDARNTVVWGAPGHVFGPWLDELHGSHGSPRCTTQVAVVGGGHSQVDPLAQWLSARRPAATRWAPAIGRLLGFDLR